MKIQVLSLNAIIKIMYFKYSNVISREVDKKIWVTINKFINNKNQQRWVKDLITVTQSIWCNYKSKALASMNNNKTNESMNWNQDYSRTWKES